MIQGLSHITFIVRDLEKMALIITEVLGGEEVYSSGDKTFSTSREKFFVAGGIWIAVQGFG
jgi:fosfomycin resistance protein FosX